MFSNVAEKRTEYYRGDARLQGAVRGEKQGTGPDMLTFSSGLEAFCNNRIQEAHLIENVSPSERSNHLPLSINF